jgi:cysteine synthase A
METVVPVVSTPYELLNDDLYVDLEPCSGHELYLKCEGLNFAGSIKLKAAREMVNQLEKSGQLTPGSILIESSSGNMGIALSMLAASRGLRFVCVTDPRCNQAAIRIMRALGAEVRTIDKPDESQGYLGSRLRYVRALCASDPRYVWLNQYNSPANWCAHYSTTGPAIARRFPHLGVLFVGAGTAGTLMGCAHYFRERSPRPRIVAVDSVGSVTFGGPPMPRRIPGLGSSVPMPQLDTDFVDDVVMVEERDAVRMCRHLATRGFLFGGSTGTVVVGARSWLDQHDPGRALTAVAIAPDLGERYLDTIYNDEWVQTVFPTEALDLGDPGESRPPVRTRPSVAAGRCPFVTAR